MGRRVGRNYLAQRRRGAEGRGNAEIEECGNAEIEEMLGCGNKRNAGMLSSDNFASWRLGARGF